MCFSFSFQFIFLFYLPFITIEIFTPKVCHNLRGELASRLLFVFFSFITTRNASPPEGLTLSAISLSLKLSAAFKIALNLISEYFPSSVSKFWICWSPLPIYPPPHLIFPFRAWVPRLATGGAAIAASPANPTRLGGTGASRRVKLGFDSYIPT